MDHAVPAIPDGDKVQGIAIVGVLKKTVQSMYLQCTCLGSLVIKLLLNTYIEYNILNTHIEYNIIMSNINVLCANLHYYK